MGNLGSLIPPAVGKPGPFHQGLCDPDHLSRLDTKSHVWGGNKGRNGKSPLLGIQNCGAQVLMPMDFSYMVIKH